MLKHICIFFLQKGKKAQKKKNMQQQQQQPVLINQKYKLVKRLASGSFGTIFQGENIRTKESVAVKVESVHSAFKLLKNETFIYQQLKNTPGVSSVKWFGKDADYYYMVIELLGDSLQHIKETSAPGSFSFSLVFKIAIQILSTLKHIHDIGYVHRDIKPDNFLIKQKRVYIVDFGFCKQIMHSGRHIECTPTHGIIGSLSYCSVNAHRRLQLSRRDDLESLGYMLLYLISGGGGELPWQMASDKEIILQMKENLLKTPATLSLHPALSSYFNQVAALEFAETPDYQSLATCFLQNI